MEIMKALNQQAYDWLETMPPNTREPLSSQPATQPNLVERSDTMVSQMAAEASQCTPMEQKVQTLPDSFFIKEGRAAAAKRRTAVYCMHHNRPEGRPIPPSTATKDGRAAAAKRRTAVEAQKKLGVKKVAAGIKKK